MATKRLSRTVLEAGQSRRRRAYAADVAGGERCRARVSRAEARRDPGQADELWIRPRRPLGKWFAPDKLGAAERWLLTRVGRPWAKVEGEILAMFDTRSVAGRHVVFDHLLPRRHGRRPETGWWVHRRFEFIVDAGGILRANQYKARPKPDHVRRSTRAWLGARKIAIRGAHAFWLEPIVRGDAEPRYRQAARLDPHECERLATFNSAEREAYVEG